MKNSTRWISALTAIISAGLLAAAPASATYEQVDTFAGTPGMLKKNGEAWPEEVQLGGVGGMAVNYTGAGGVPAGTIYASGRASNGPENMTVRYNPDGSFSEAWTFALFAGSGPPEERCGPEGDPAEPTCLSRPEGGSGIATDTEVDQATGDVYTLNIENPPVGANVIHVYSPDGSKLIAQFGEKAPFGEAITASPSKIHDVFSGGIAVGTGGKVYVLDGETGQGGSRRVMAFEPQSPGDYEHYVYAGQGKDVPVGGVGGKGPISIDTAGHLYRSDEERIVEYDPGQPAAPPLCEFNFPKGGIKSMTVNQASGEAFFFTTKDKKVHQLSACDEEGHFEEVGSFAPVPKRNYISALAFDPVRQFDPSRPAGVLYAGSPVAEGGKTEGTPPDLLVESALGYVFAPPTALPPAIESEAASAVSSSGATLGTQINPRGATTDYRFQYITEAAYQANEPADRFAGSQETPVGGALLGEGQKPLSAVVYLSGLAPDTTYRFRAIATSHCSSEHPEEICEAVGAAQPFRTFPAEAPGLPDKRAYELVSPTDKHGSSVWPAHPQIRSCVIECTLKPGVAALHYPMLSSPDGEAIVYEGGPFSGAEAVAGQNAYIAHRDAKAGWQTTSLAPTQAGVFGGEEGYWGFTGGLTQAVFKHNVTLSPQAPADYPNFYVQPTSNPLVLTPLLTEAPPNRPPGTGQVRLILNYAGASADFSRIFFAANDALTKETAFAPEALDGGASQKNLYEWSAGQLRLVNVLPDNTTIPGAAFGAGNAHAVSDDGSRVFWEDAAHQVYLREDAETTKAISTAGTPDPGAFLAAKPGGSKVLLANGHLHDVEEEEPTVDLTDGKGGFQGLVGNSEDLSRIYFVDTAVLSGEEENSEGAKAQAGKDNLYAWEQGDGTHYVATLSAADGGKMVSDWATSASQRIAEASPNGRWLAFLSVARLTGYDNTGPCELLDAVTHEMGLSPCTEAFLYDSQTGELACASCNPSLTAPLGPSHLRLIQDVDSSVPQPRYLSDSGRLFFDSQDALSIFDTNEGVEDVYEFEPQGVGTCERPAGCVSLISAGAEALDSNLLAVDQSGKSAFFTTRDQLSPRDHDDLIDLYVAREDGGIPVESETARGECQGEACQPLVSAPNDPTPATSLVEGAGNVDEQKATKKHKKKKKHAKKHKRAKHTRANHDRGGAK